MRKIFNLIFVLSAFVFGIQPDDRGYIVKVGDDIPNFSLQFIDGTILSSSDLNGKVIVLQFTASWCSVCRKEMPYLEKEVWQTFRDKGFILIGIDRDEPLDIVQQFKKEMNVTYPMALDPGAEIFGLFADKESGVTRNVIIDQNGKIVFLTRLFDEKEFKNMVEFIKKLTENNQPR